MAFVAGAVVMLIVALLWGAWIGHAGAGRIVRAMAVTATNVPDLKPPHLPPDGPKLPDAPKPIPK
jgi:hypothetical protein